MNNHKATEAAKEAESEKALKHTESIAGKQFIDDVRDYITCCGEFHGVSVERSTSNALRALTRQDESEYAFGYVLLWQRAGVCGDDYYGEVFIPLPTGEFLKCAF